MDELSAQPAGSEAPTRSRFALDEGWDLDGDGDADEDDALSALVSRRYELGRLIGSGATARVYRAYDHTLDREVAIKVFHREVVPVEQRRRLHEVAVMDSLDHPGVVPLFDTGAEDGHTFLVMRLVDGQNLADRLRSGPLDPDEVTALATRLADALAYLHERGVTHRDLKPANVLLGEEGPVISDFGIARAADATRVTATGAIVGTAAYMAPEQVLGELVGAPADIYALGLILLECLTGVREYTGTMAECAIARLTRQPRIPPDLPPALALLLGQMTARIPSARPTAAAVRQALGTDAETPVPEARSVPVVLRPVARRFGAVLAGVLVAAAVVVYSFSFPAAVQGTPESAPPSAVSPPSSTQPQPSSPASPAAGNPVAVTGAPQAPGDADAGGVVSPPAAALGGKKKPGKVPKKNIVKGKGHGWGHGGGGKGGPAGP